MEGIIGQVGGLTSVVTANLTLDTNAYATGDVLADKLTVTGAVRNPGGTGYLTELTVIDKDSQGKALDLVFFRKDFTLQAKNAAFAVSDADADSVLGMVTIADADWVACGANFSVATVTGINLGINCDGKDLYVAAISRGNGTYTAAGLRIKLTIVQD
jgi:hypothetical protein